MTSCRAKGGAALLAGLVGATWAAAQPMAEMELPSCVRGSPPLRASSDTPRAALDGRDRARFEQAAQARYPLYEQGGLVSTQVLMLRRGGQWLYVALMPGGPTGLCFTAVFAADRFDFTPGWLAKYQPRPADLED